MVDIIPGIQILRTIISIHVLVSGTDYPQRLSSPTVIVLTRETAVATKNLVSAWLCRKL